jgi:glutamine amidotransferase
VIGIIDYGLGNLGSVTKAFRYVGAEVALSADSRTLLGADALVLPGDGAFGATMDEIRQRGLVEPLREAVRRGTPLLGICVGMQVLFEESEEHGRHVGLGLLPGRVRRFFADAPAAHLPVPHMGWNRLLPEQPHALLEGLPERPHVYFVHSYYCDAAPDIVIASAEYGLRFAAIVARGSVLGMQFHPEKSQTVGLKLIENFVRDVAARSGRRDSASIGGPA